MTQIKFVCPSCRQPFEAPLDMADTDLLCPKCQQNIRVPLPANIQSNGIKSLRQDRPRFDGDSAALEAPPPISPSMAAWKKTLWIGIACIVVFGIFQPICTGKWWCGFDNTYHHIDNFFSYFLSRYHGPNEWELVPIFDGIRDSTIPFLIRIGLATAIIAIGLLPPLKFNIRQRRVLVGGTLVAFLFSLFKYEDGFCPIFSKTFVYEPTAKFLVGLAVFITAAALVSLHSWKGEQPR